MQRVPFKNNFSPSRRHSRQTGPRYFATSLPPVIGHHSHGVPSFFLIRSSALLDPTPLRRTTAVVWDRRHVANQIDPQSRPLQRTNRRLTPRSRPVHIDIDLPHSAFHCLAGGGFTGSLCGERRALSGPLEALIPGAGPDDRVAAHIGNRDDGVVERGLHVGDATLDNPSFFLLAFFYAHTRLLQWNVLRARRRAGGRFRFAAHSSTTALPCPRVGFRTLAANRQAFTMAETAICAGIDQPLDVHGKRFSEITFDLVLLLNDLADLHNLIFTEILHTNRAIDPGLIQDVPRRSPPDPKYIGQANVRPLLSR